MEGQGRKRKLEGVEEEEEQGEENEEQKMEKFFALIRRTKDARDRLSKERENTKVEEEKEKAVWNPTFQPEDFIHDYNKDFGNRSTHLLATSAGPSYEKELQVQRPEPEPEPEPTAQAAPPPPPPPHPNEDKEKASEGDKLDLTLSL